MKILERPLNGGTQIIHRFDNNYGASVVRHNSSYGHEKKLWELAVIRFDGDDFIIDYDTEITNDVIGYLTQKDVDKTLQQIESLRIKEQK